MSISGDPKQLILEHRGHWSPADVQSSCFGTAFKDGQFPHSEKRCLPVPLPAPAFVKSQEVPCVVPGCW